MMLGMFTDSLDPAIALSGDGTGTGITGTLGTSMTDGTPVAVNGMSNVELPLVIGVVGGHTVTVGLVNRTADGDFPIPFSVDGGAFVLSKDFTAGGNHVLATNLGGVVEKLVAQAKTSNAGSASDSVKGPLKYAQGSV
jgi:hypothetical protein